MIGVFDSGDGGLFALSEIRRIMPCADIAFLADRSNAPYGTKTKKELLSLVCNDISRLLEKGAERILMACCTASAVYPYLPGKMKETAIPIINPAAREACAATKSGKIGVIATEYTAASGAFRRALSRYRGVRAVYELPMQSLVYAVESGISDRSITASERQRLHRMLFPLKEKSIDTLILGCTHFSHLEREIGNCLPNVRIINPAREGAKEITNKLLPHGKGITIYME